MFKPSELYARLEAIDRDLAALNDEREWVRSKLEESIPENMAADGVYHEFSRGKSVPYKKVFETVVSTLVPKTKRDNAYRIRDDLSSKPERHHFRLAELSDEHVENYAEGVAI